MASKQITGNMSDHDKQQASPSMKMADKDVSMASRSEQGEQVRAWSEHGQSMVRAWSEHGQSMVRAWSEHGQSMVRVTQRERERREPKERRRGKTYNARDEGGINK
jgi:hypothetical protein